MVRRHRQLATDVEEPSISRLQNNLNLPLAEDFMCALLDILPKI